MKLNIELTGARAEEGIAAAFSYSTNWQVSLTRVKTLDKSV